MQSVEHCENCGTVLNGPFCSQCGQRAISPVVSLRQFASDVLDGLFSVDSRIWRTILPLLFQPGSLTRDYLAGRRERYLPPFRTYLIMSLLFFMIASVFGTDWEITADHKPLSPDAQTSSINTSNSDESEDFSCQKLQIEGIGFFDDLDLEARVRKACEKIQADSGNSLIRALAENIPMMMFLFIPFVALLMKILYLFSHRKYIEHLVFIFHYHAAFFMILAIIVILAAIERSSPLLATPALIASAFAWIYIPAYLLVAMRRVYYQSWFLTNIKFVLLLFGYTIILFMAFAVATIYTALVL
jgi:hypothetical protein